MARLRTLLITTADGPRDILILDKTEPAQVANISPANLKESGLPPIIAFEGEVELPDVDALTEDEKATQDAINQLKEDIEAAQHTRITLDTTGTDDDLVRAICKHIKTGRPGGNVQTALGKEPR